MTDPNNVFMDGVQLVECDDDGSVTFIALFDTETNNCTLLQIFLSRTKGSTFDPI